VRVPLKFKKLLNGSLTKIISRKYLQNFRNYFCTRKFILYFQSQTCRKQMF
jgi:hypothetical protein